MSDEEEVYSEEERGEEEDEERAPKASSGPSEAELAMQRRRNQLMAAGIEEQYLDLLEEARKEREREEEEIAQLRKKREQRKREREEEEKAAAERRAEEEARRKAEEERRRKKEDEERERKAKLAAKLSELDKLKNPAKPNFVISKREDGFSVEGEDEDESKGEKKSKEQLEAEKKAILSQRIPEKPDVASMDEAKLAEKAKEFHKEIFRIESEKYDLEKRFKEQQRDMMELAEQARNINKVGKDGLKRQGIDESDKIAEKFAGIPAKVQMYSKYERQKDKRTFNEKHVVFHGATWLFAPEKLRPTRIVKFNPDTGLPEYEDIPGMEGAREEEVEEE